LEETSCGRQDPTRVVEQLMMKGCYYPERPNLPQMTCDANEKTHLSNLLHGIETKDLK